MQDQYSADDKMCHLWFNTAFVERNYLVFDKAVVDRACKDKYATFPFSLCVFSMSCVTPYLSQEPPHI